MVFFLSFPSRGVFKTCVALTRWEADAVPVLELEAGALEFAFPLLDVGLVLVELEDEDVELALQHVDLALRQLLLATLQQLLLGLLLQGGASQLLFPGTQLLDEGTPKTHTALQTTML